MAKGFFRFLEALKCLKMFFQNPPKKSRYHFNFFGLLFFWVSSSFSKLYLSIPCQAFQKNLTPRPLRSMKSDGIWSPSLCSSSSGRHKNCFGRSRAPKLDWNTNLKSSKFLGVWNRTVKGGPGGFGWFIFFLTYREVQGTVTFQEYHHLVVAQDDRCWFIWSRSPLWDFRFEWRWQHRQRGQTGRAADRCRPGFGRGTTQIRNCAAWVWSCLALG